MVHLTTAKAERGAVTLAPEHPPSCRFFLILVANPKNPDFHQAWEGERGKVLREGKPRFNKKG